MHEALPTTLQSAFANRPAPQRLAPLAALLALTIFPFEWLGARWPAFGHALDRAFATEVAHAIGHATLFMILGLVALTLAPALRRRPWRYAGLLMLAGLGQEGLQLVFKRRALVFDDARDLLIDLLGLAIAFALSRLWQRAVARQTTHNQGI